MLCATALMLVVVPGGHRAGHIVHGNRTSWCGKPPKPPRKLHYAARDCLSACDRRVAYQRFRGCRGRRRTRKQLVRPYQTGPCRVPSRPPMTMPVISSMPGTCVQASTALRKVSISFANIGFVFCNFGLTCLQCSQQLIEHQPCDRRRLARSMPARVDCASCVARRPRGRPAQLHPAYPR